MLQRPLGIRPSVNSAVEGLTFQSLESGAGPGGLLSAPPEVRGAVGFGQDKCSALGFVKAMEVGGSAMSGSFGQGQHRVRWAPL